MKDELITRWLERNRDRLAAEGWTVTTAVSSHKTWDIRFESGDHLAQRIVWDSGEAEYNALNLASSAVLIPHTRQVRSTSDLARVVKEMLRDASALLWRCREGPAIATR